MTATIPYEEDLERPCATCKVGSGEPCVTRAWAGHPSRPFGGVHVDRRKNFNTAPMGVIRQAGRWTGAERRTWGEEDIRTDEKTGLMLKLTAWMGTLPDDDARRVGVLAAIEIIGEGR